MLDTLLSLVAPHHCLDCAKTGSLLCPSCKNYISNVSYSRCVMCQKPLKSNGSCSSCKWFERAVIAGSHHSVLGELVRFMKFTPARAAADVAAQIIADCLPELPKGAVIVPIPTTRQHRRLRGFDHTRRIAHKLTRVTRSHTQTILKRNHAAVQVGASRVQRQRQAKNAFRAHTTLSNDTLYLLLDDVITTGATMRAAAQALKDAGACHIWIISLTHEPLDERNTIC